MEIRLTDDMAFCTAMMLHPAIWPDLVNDDVPPREQFEAPEGYVYFAALNEGLPAGLFGLRVIGRNALALHVAMLPAFRGRGTRKAGEAMLDWIWTNTPTDRVVVRFEARNGRARAAAVRAGFRECGRHAGAVRVAGEPMDLIEMEVCRGLSG